MDEQGAIFFIETDREALLSILASVIKRFQWVCHAYCLMDNHYRFLTETPEGNYSRGYSSFAKGEIKARMVSEGD